MEEKTADEIAAIFSAAGDSVTLINADANFAAYQTTNPSSFQTETEWKEMTKFANETFVDESDELKEKSAGAGLTDND